MLSISGYIPLSPNLVYLSQALKLQRLPRLPVKLCFSKGLRPLTVGFIGHSTNCRTVGKPEPDSSIQSCPFLMHPYSQLRGDSMPCRSQQATKNMHHTHATVSITANTKRSVLIRLWGRFGASLGAICTPQTLQPAGRTAPKAQKRASALAVPARHAAHWSTSLFISHPLLCASRPPSPVHTLAITQRDLLLYPKPVAHHHQR